MINFPGISERETQPLPEAIGKSSAALDRNDENRLAFAVK